MSIKTTHAWRKGDDILDRDGKTIWRIQILKGRTMLATKVEPTTMKQTGIKLDGYVLNKDGKLVRDPKHLDASQRKKRQAAAMKRKRGKG